MFIDLHIFSQMFMDFHISFRIIMDSYRLSSMFIDFDGFPLKTKVPSVPLDKKMRGRGRGYSHFLKSSLSAKACFSNLGLIFLLNVFLFSGLGVGIYLALERNECRVGKRKVVGGNAAPDLGVDLSSCRFLDLLIFRFICYLL